MDVDKRKKNVWCSATDITCFNCNKKGHYKSDCKAKQLSNIHIIISEDGTKTTYVGNREANDEEKKLLAKCTPIDDELNMRIQSPLGLIILPDYKAGIWACIDSGTEVLLISKSMVRKLQIPTYQVKRKFKTTSFTGKDQEWVTRKCTIKMEIKEQIICIKCYIGPLMGKEHVLLGMLFLKEYKPHMNWETGKITCWDDGFKYPGKPAIKEASIAEIQVSINKTTLSTELEAAQAALKEEVQLPERYQDFAKVFAEDDIPLPKHRPGLDHEIRL
ncbi:hypothetical protein M404DRAFT_35918 [Pisolithus tinctorius Marx 270]|uniref:CCHC-type domain-containing protein n=1 Tax=Pisolithus tinctorius Marx 270 TaxID=870435 RepID=A0A0C3MXK0_PISTI|nr:hypothetical protein M404DRAFT_35918 [Pisolithus tinctorius Marx 270]